MLDGDRESLTRDLQQDMPSSTDLQMIARILGLAAPCIASNLLWFLMQVLTQAYVGQRLGKDAVGCYAVGTSIFNVCGLSVGIGFACALDTLASQAYGRDPTGPQIGELLQRSVLVVTLISIPIVCLFHFSEPVLILIFGSVIGTGAAEVLRGAWLYLPLNMINTCIVKVLQAQNVPHLQLFATGTSVAACLFFNRWLVHSSLLEAMTVLTLSHTVLLCALVMTCYLHPKVVLRYAEWPLSPNVCERAAMRQFMSVGFAAFVSVCSEWWAFEALMIIAAQISTADVTLLGLCFSVTTLCFSLPFGFSMASTVTVANNCRWGTFCA